MVVMGVSELCIEGIINDLVVILGDLLGRMEVMEILGVLVIEGRNYELEKLETSLMWFQVHHHK